MAEHYCKEHKTTWFKKGKMKGYAHPIGDTGDWCNEPQPEDAPKEQQFSVEPEKREYPEETKYKVDPAKTASIEAQQAAEFTKDLWIAGKLQDGEPEVQGLRLWIRTRLNAPQSNPRAPKTQTAPITHKEVEKALTDEGLPTVERIRPVTLAALQALNNIPRNHEKIVAKAESMGWGLKGKPLSALKQPQAMILLGLFPDDDKLPVDIPF